MPLRTAEEVTDFCLKLAEARWDVDHPVLGSRVPWIRAFGAHEIGKSYNVSTETLREVYTRLVGKCEEMFGSKPNLKVTVETLTGACYELTSLVLNIRSDIINHRETQILDADGEIDGVVYVQALVYTMSKMIHEMRGQE